MLLNGIWQIISKKFVLSIYLEVLNVVLSLFIN